MGDRSCVEQSTHLVNRTCAAGAIPIGAPYKSRGDGSAYTTWIVRRGDPGRQSNKGMSDLLTGCPLLAFATTSAARVRMVLTPISSVDKGEKFAIVRKSSKGR